MERVTVTITTDKPVSVKITPSKDAFELLEALDGDEAEEGDGDDDIKRKAYA